MFNLFLGRGYIAKNMKSVSIAYKWHFNITGETWNRNDMPVVPLMTNPGMHIRNEFVVTLTLRDVQFLPPNSMNKDLFVYFAGNCICFFILHHV